ncbi:MAG TPA: AraC family transcriptional regulator [Polyangiaceae bacterium]|nr:AraC family transcriptional regulator [Polyangiaceae bacterium]
MRGPAVRENLVSIRLTWPFARLSGAGPRALSLLHQVGIEPADFANPDTRIPHRTAIELLDAGTANRQDPTIGLQAGSLAEPCDLDVLEYAARSRPTLGDALSCIARYYRLMHAAAEFLLIEQGDRVVYRYRVNDGVHQPPAANDFVLGSTLSFVRRNSAPGVDAAEVHFAHPEPAYVEAYRRYFSCPVFFGGGTNDIVFHKSTLSAPMARSDPTVSEAYEQHARRLLERLPAIEGVAGRVRRIVVEQLRGGEVTMEFMAIKMAMSVPTLRRRLDQEGTTFSDIVDEIRKELAERYLREPSVAVSEVAFLLGFSSESAFHRAFRRWTGVAPSEFRARARNFPSLRPSADEGSSERAR